MNRDENGKLCGDVCFDEAARKAAYVQPAPNITTGWLGRYARMVTSADEGAVLR